MGSRYDMYNNVHRGLRAMLTDAGARWSLVEEQLTAHHRRERACIGPHLERIAPELFARWERDHRAIEVELARVSAAAASESFAQALAGFLDTYSTHLTNVEAAYTAVLQSAYTDRDLMAIERELLAKF